MSFSRWRRFDLATAVINQMESAGGGGGGDLVACLLDSGLWLCVLGGCWWYPGGRAVAHRGDVCGGGGCCSRVRVGIWNVCIMRVCVPGIFRLDQKKLKSLDSLWAMVKRSNHRYSQSAIITPYLLHSLPKPFRQLITTPSGGESR